jgi:hypothetical protein
VRDDQAAESKHAQQQKSLSAHNQEKQQLYAYGPSHRSKQKRNKTAQLQESVSRTSSRCACTWGGKRARRNHQREHTDGAEKKSCMEIKQDGTLKAHQRENENSISTLAEENKNRD